VVLLAQLNQRSAIPGQPVVIVTDADDSRPA